MAVPDEQRHNKALVNCSAVACNAENAVQQKW